MSKKPSPEKSVTKPPSPGNRDLRSEIERQIGPLISGGQREQIVSRVLVMMTEQFSGPLAHPRHFREYDEILPGSAERIVQMAEKAQEHNRDMEARLVKASIWETKMGMILGFVALMVLIGIAAYAGLNDLPIVAGLFLTAGLLGAASTLIRGNKGNNS